MGLPLREPYMRLSSRTAQAKHPNTSWNGYVIENSKLLFLISNSIFSEDTREDKKNPKAFLYGDNTKISSWLSRLYLDSYRPPESSFSLFFSLLFCIKCSFYLLFSLLLIGILLLRPYESIKTSDSY